MKVPAFKQAFESPSKFLEKAFPAVRGQPWTFYPYLPTWSNARQVYLAYAFARGVPYRVVEPTAKGEPFPVLCKNVAAIAAHFGFPATPEDMERWFLTPEEPVRRTARLVHEKETMEKRRAARAAYAATMRERFGAKS